MQDKKKNRNKCNMLNSWWLEDVYHPLVEFRGPASSFSSCFQVRFVLVSSPPGMIPMYFPDARMVKDHMESLIKTAAQAFGPGWSKMFPFFIGWNHAEY